MKTEKTGDGNSHARKAHVLPDEESAPRQGRGSLRSMISVIAAVAIPFLYAEDKLESTRKAAEQGDAEAQFSLGVCYANGRDVQRADAEALKWYRRAADQDHVLAQFRRHGRHKTVLHGHLQQLPFALYFPAHCSFFSSFS